jgi:hypothetical protein
LVGSTDAEPWIWRANCIKATTFSDAYIVLNRWGIFKARLSNYVVDENITYNTLLNINILNVNIKNS